MEAEVSTGGVRGAGRGRNSQTCSFRKRAASAFSTGSSGVRIALSYPHSQRQDGWTVKTPTVVCHWLQAAPGDEAVVFQKSPGQAASISQGRTVFREG